MLGLGPIHLAKGMAFAVDMTSLLHFARHFFSVFDTERNKKAKWITSSSPSSPPAKIAKMAAAASFKAAREQDRPFEWMLASNQRSDRRVTVVGEQSILSSLRHPSLNISFTINRWAHFVAVKLPISDHLNVKQLDIDVFHSANTWVMAFTSLCFVINILLTSQTLCDV